MRILNKKSFTLLEIIFALAILVIGIVGVLAIFPVGLRASKRGGDFTSATLAAQQVMETIRLRGYDVYDPGQYPPGFTEPPGPPYPFTDDAAGTLLPEGFSWMARVISAPGIDHLRQVTLSIYWLDRGSYRWEDFTTYLADRN